MPGDPNAPQLADYPARGAAWDGGATTATAIVDPDNPPWGLLAALGVLVGSLVLLAIVPIAAIIPYLIWLRPDPQMIGGIITTDKTALLIAILANLPAHLLTFALCWMVVTRLGKRPFWHTLGWSWSPRVGFGASIGIGVGLFLLGVGISQIFTEQETQLSRIINSSLAVRYSVVAMATLTAPLAEELVYRGVLYSALQRAVGLVWGVIGVMLVFALIHVPQYYPSWGAITTIVVLSLTLTLLRAYTGRLLPCVVVHTIFNSISSVAILLEPHFKNATPAPDQPAASALLFPLVARLAHLFF